MNNAAAFNTISIDYILFVLTHMGFQRNSLDTDRELYRDCSTIVTGEGQSTDRIEVNVGV